MTKKLLSRSRSSRKSASRNTSSLKKATKKMAARPAKKKAAKRKAARRARPGPKLAPEIVLARAAPIGGVAFRATAAGCLDQEVAMAIVFGCIPGPVPLGTLLGTLFPSDVVRRGFCGCVFNTARQAGSIITPGAVPCAASTSVGDVIDAISC